MLLWCFISTSFEGKVSEGSWQCKIAIHSEIANFWLSCSVYNIIHCDFIISIIHWGVQRLCPTVCRRILCLRPALSLSSSKDGRQKAIFASLYTTVFLNIRRTHLLIRKTNHEGTADLRERTRVFAEMRVRKRTESSFDWLSAYIEFTRSDFNLLYTLSKPRLPLL